MLSAEHQGFLHATVEDQAKTRWQQYMEVTGEIPPLPDTKQGEHMLDAMHKIGAYKSSGMGGIEPMDWRDIDAFNRLMQMEFEPFEVETIMQLSRKYVDGYHIGQQSNGIAPYFDWTPIPTDWPKL